MAGSKMKSKGITYWSSQSAGTDNSSGFSALPGGYRNDSGSFFNVRTSAFFWSATKYDSSGAWFRGLDYYNGNVNRNVDYKSVGVSVRCLRD